MTVEEAKTKYNSGKFYASDGDNLNRICWQLYGNLNPQNIYALTKINIRYDWDNVKPGDAIIFFPEAVMKSIQ